MTLPGLSSTALILIIFDWNEAFWSINLTGANAAALTAFIASYSSPEGLFLAKLSAASFLRFLGIQPEPAFGGRRFARFVIIVDCLESIT
jgi:ABC-type glycerol-3-phosphate transport system permease component